MEAILLPALPSCLGGIQAGALASSQSGSGSVVVERSYDAVVELGISRVVVVGHHVVDIDHKSV